MVSCRVCHKSFATNYTLKRHQETIHDAEDEMVDEEEEEDVDSKTGSDSDRDTDSKKEDSEGDGEDKEDDTSSEDSDTIDFWGELVGDVAAAWTQDDTANYLGDDEVDVVGQLLKPPYLDMIIEKARVMFNYHSDMADAGELDYVMKEIADQKKKMRKQKHLKKNLSEKEIDELAWGQCAYLVKKRLQENVEALKPILEDQDSSEAPRYV